MKAIETDYKIILDIAIVNLHQSSRQERKLYATSMMKAQPHQEQTYAITQIHTRKQQGNLSQLINAEQTRKKIHRTDGVIPISTT